MTLTVPRAGTTAGRAPEIRVEAPQTGAMIAGLGERMLQVGGALEQERLDRELRQTRLTAMERLQQLRTEFDGIGDPDVIDRDWPERTDALRAELVPDSMDPRIRDRAGEIFDEMRIVHSGGLGRRAMALRQSQRRVILAGMADVAVRAAAQGDPEPSQAYLDSHDEQLADAVAQGLIDPEQARTMSQSARREAATARALAMLREDPAGLAAALADPGQLRGLDGAEREGWITRADAAIGQAESARQAEIGRDLAEATRIAARGGRSAREAEMIASDEYLDHPDAEAFAQAVYLRDEMPGLALRPPAEIRETVAQIEAGTVGRAFELDVRDAARRLLEEAEEGWRTDPIGHAAEIGIMDFQELPDLATADPAELRRMLFQRRAQGDWFAANGYVERPAYFSAAEREQWGAAIGAGQTPAVRVQMAAAIASAFPPERLDDVLAEIGGDPVFAHTTGLLDATGSRALAEDIFEGQRALAQSDVPLPGVPQRRNAWFLNFSAAFLPEEAGIRDQLIGAADALYALRARGERRHADGRLDERLWLQAAHEVAGGTGTYGSRGARGGLQMVRGAATLLPSGIGAQEVERGLQMLGNLLPTMPGAPAGGIVLLDPRRVGGQPIRPDWVQEGEEREEAVERMLRALSPTGALPAFRDAVVDQPTWSRMRLQSLGGDRYRLVLLDETGAVYALPDGNGDNWVLSLNALLATGRGEAP